MKTLKQLKQLNPCKSGYKFAKSKKSLIEAWNTCERGDWMLWFARQLNAPLQLLTLAKGLCAETVIHLMCDDRSRNAIKVAIDFGNGIATREELSAASDAAFNASDDAFNNNAFNDDNVTAAAYNAAYAAFAAADASFNDDDASFDDDDASFDDDAYNNAAAANAANAATNAAYAAADAAASDAAADAAEKANQLKTANICRLILTDFIKSVLTNKIEGYCC